MNSFSQRALRAAFIGGDTDSAIGYTHFNASRLDGHFRVEAGCFSRNQEKNQHAAKVYGVNSNRVYGHWRDLLDSEKADLDVIIVLTPIPSHMEIVIAALDAGYPVICEKALAVSSAECISIEESVKANNGYLAVTYNYSGYPMVRELRKMISEGQLGRIQQIHIEMPQESLARSGANPQDWRRIDYDVPTVSLDLGVHVHHLVDFVTSGKKPLRLTADQTSYGKFPGLIDNVYAIVNYEEDLRVQAWWGKTALGHRNGLRIRVYGSKASAEWYQINPEDLLWADDDGHYFRLDRGSNEATTASETRYNRFKAGHPSGFVEGFANLYADIACDIRSYLKNDGQENPYVYGSAQGRESLNFIEKVSESAVSRQWISF